MFGIYASLWKRGHFQDVFWGFERNLNVIIQYLSFQKTSAENFTNCQKKKKKPFTADSSDLSCRLLFIYFHLYSYLIEKGFFLSHIYILLHN